jgi:hypothetical protein
MMRCSREEKTMKRLTLVLFVAFFQIVSYSSAQQQMERKGTASTVKLAEVMEVLSRSV